MKRGRFKEEQIITILKEAEAAAKVEVMAHGFSQRPPAGCRCPCKMDTNLGAAGQMALARDR